MFNKAQQLAKHTEKQTFTSKLYTLGDVDMHTNKCMYSVTSHTFTQHQYTHALTVALTCGHKTYKLLHAHVHTYTSNTRAQTQHTLTHSLTHTHTRTHTHTAHVHTYAPRYKAVNTCIILGQI